MKTIPELTPRQQTLLVFLNHKGSQELDPIRIMKGLFLFAQQAPTDWVPRDARYEFEPYDYGPCSFQIYADLDQLRQSGYVTASQVPGRSWKYYSLTAEGRKIAQRVIKGMNTHAVTYLQTLRDFVTKISFRQLLTAVYRRYPEYAVNSVFKS